MSDAPDPPRVPISIWILWFLFVSQCAALAVHVWRNHELAGLPLIGFAVFGGLLAFALALRGHELRQLRAGRWDKKGPKYVSDPPPHFWDFGERVGRRLEQFELGGDVPHLRADLSAESSAEEKDEKAGE